MSTLTSRLHFTPFQCAALLAIAAPFGCATRLIDRSVADGGAVAESDGGACVTHELVTVPLVAINLIDPVERFGAAVRVAPSYVLRGCDRPGPIEIQSSFGESFQVQLIARVWRPIGGGAECNKLGTETRILNLTDAVKLVNLFDQPIEVRDGAPGGTATLQLTFPFPSSPDCGARAIGGACESDCQCKSAELSARCIPVGTVFQWSGVCATPCSEDADCASPGSLLPRCNMLSVAPFTCGSGQCTGDGECPFGQRCVATQGQSACRPAATADLPPCGCDGDCGFGQLCNGKACVTPCVTAADCALLGPPPLGQGECDLTLGFCTFPI